MINNEYVVDAFLNTDIPENTIVFYFDNGNTEILKLSKDGIWVNPDVPVDEIARNVFEVLEPMIMHAYSLHPYTVEENKRLKEIIDRVKKVCDEELRYVDSLPIREALGEEYEQEVGRE